MLKFVVDNLEGLSEEVAKNYEKSEDGKYQLKVDGLPVQEDTTGLKNALQAERNAVADLKRQARDWQALGETPDAVAAKIKELSDAKGDPSEQEKMLEQLQAKHAKELENITTQRDAALVSEREAIINAGFTAALAESGFTKTGLELIPKIHSDRIVMVEQDGKRVPQIMTKDGSGALVGSGKNNYATFEDLAKELAETYPDLVQAERKGGAGSSPGPRGPSGEKVMKRLDWDALSPAEQMSIVSKGTKIVD